MNQAKVTTSEIFLTADQAGAAQPEGAVVVCLDDWSTTHFTVTGGQISEGENRNPYGQPTGAPVSEQEREEARCRYEEFATANARERARHIHNAFANIR